MDSSQVEEPRNEPSDSADAAPSTPWYRRPMGRSSLGLPCDPDRLAIFAIIFLTGGDTNAPPPATTPSTTITTTTSAPTTTRSKHHHLPTLPWRTTTTPPSSP
jgi:hypothetical protein